MGYRQWLVLGVVTVAAGLVGGAAPLARANGPAKVVEIEIKGTDLLSLEDVLPDLKTQVGAPVDEDLMQLDARRIQLLGRGKFEAVTPATERVRKGVRVVFQVAQRPAAGGDPAPTDEGPGGASSAAGAEGGDPSPLRPAVASTDPGPAKLGLVDIEVVEQDWTAAEGLAEHRAMRERQLQIKEAEIEYRRRYPFLAEQLMEELITLRFYTQDLKDQQKRRISELEELSDAQAEEYQSLLDKMDRNAEEKARFSTLDEVRSNRLEDRQREIEQLVANRDGVQQELLSLRDQLMAKIRVVARDMAPELGLSYVIRTDSVLWGGQDVTDAIVKELNRRYPKLEDAAKEET